MLSPDSLALLLIFTHLAVEEEADYAPLPPREWTKLHNRLDDINEKPGSLLGLSVTSLQALLECPIEKSILLIRLMERSDRLTHELERLASLSIHPMTIVDEDYPDRFHQRLKGSAPPVLFYAGEKALLGQPGIAVVGSRKLDQVGQECATYVGEACGLSGLVLYSGGAKGVDTFSMDAALNSRGTAVGVLADSLVRAIRPPGVRSALARGDLCLVTPQAPEAGFSVGAAMGRNRLIYTLADYAIVVASEEEKGGTWAGATESLKHRWLPIFVLQHPSMPPGNRRLIEKGGIPFPYPFPVHFSKLGEWLQAQASRTNPDTAQLKLF